MKQRPPKLSSRKNIPPKVDLPVKPEPKVSLINEAKVVKEVKKQEEVEKPVAPVPVEPQHSGHYELNERMTRMVVTELRDIMIKVWQELPDNPSDEAESLVVDKLRNEAGDDLRNVLGLNVTKRLLNVYNPLYVKVQFSGKPEKVHLGEFLKKYNFTAFKRIEKTVNMFAAQVKTISDFDKICSAKDVRCGNIIVTVNPIYKFTKCPPNLVTSFYDKYEEVIDDTTTEINKKDIGIKEAVNDKVELTTDKNKSLEKIISKNENTLKPNIAPIKTVNVAKVDKNVNQAKIVSKTVENKINPPVENKTTLNKAPVANKTAVDNKAVVNKPTVENKILVNKPTIENKTSVNKATLAIKPAVENKIAVNKSTVENKTDINKPAVENNIAVNKAAVTNKTTVNVPAVENKSNFNKPTVANKTAINKAAVTNKTVAYNDAGEVKTAVNKPHVENKVVTKLAQINAKNSDTLKKANPSPVKPQIKITDAKVSSETKQNKLEKKTDKVESDYDELDDHDILALMSEGIILDECSGSDDE